MEEGEIRMAAGMYALVAEMESIKADIEAMKADNIEKEDIGHALAWDGSSFREAAGELTAIAKRLREEI